jgi:hypothetical protein
MLAGVLYKNDVDGDLFEKRKMGCMLGCKDRGDDDIYTRDDGHHHHHHHNRSHRRVVPDDNYCLICRCQQYAQRQRGSNQCYCGHSPGEHKRT